MTQEELKQTLKNKLKQCDKDTLVDIITDICLMYIRARIFISIDCANCIKESLDNTQTYTQEINNYVQEINNLIIQKVNTNLYDTRK
jgi:hypothetical protein